MRTNVTIEVNLSSVSDTSKCERNIKKMVKITTRNQFECLVALMDENPELAKGFYKCPDKNYLRNFWKQAAMKLNSLGPPVRDGEGWQKVWNDYKLKTKKKVVFNRQLKAKGAPLYKHHVFSNLEETVIKLMCLDNVMSRATITVGIAPMQDSAIDETAALEEKILSDTADDEDCEPTPSSNLSKNQTQQSVSNDEDVKISNGLSKSCECETRTQAGSYESSEKETDIHKNMYISIAKSLRNIEENSKETTRIWQKILEIKEEKLLIYKRNLEDKAEYRREKQKLRKKKHELKRLNLGQKLHSLEESTNTYSEK